MGRYVIRRLLQAIPVFLGATLLIYSLVFLIPGDPIRALAGERPLPANVQAELRDQYDLDDPFLVQYGKYMGIVRDDDTGDYNGIIQGNFGSNFRNRPVLDIMKQAFPVTIRLALAALIIEIVIGIAAGVLAGLKQGSFIDNLVKVSTIAVVSVPIFVTAYLVQIYFGIELGWVPISFRASDGWIAYLMPAIVLGSLSLAYVARLARTQLVENKRADFVRTARAKGLTQPRVTIRHTLRNSLIPVVTYLGVDFGNLLGGAIVTETVFNIPGIGRTAFEGVLQQEGTVVVGIITALVLIFVAANLLVDILYARLDPRIRYE